MRLIPGIPYRFEDPELLTQALTHRSLGRHNYERLEFLGDSILNFVVSARLYELKADNNEGELSRLRARVVRGETLAAIATGLKLSDYIRMDKGSMKSGGDKRGSILADALEAIFGAIYIDGGFEPCHSVILHICGQFIADLPEADELKDPKTRLQEWLQGQGHALPVYSLEREDGPPHKKHFQVQCVAAAAGISVTGQGSSRQKAEQAAAATALEQVSLNPGR